MQAEAKLTKELKLTAMSEKHDRDVRLRKARGYLAKGVLSATLHARTRTQQPQPTCALLARQCAEGDGSLCRSV